MARQSKAEVERQAELVRRASQRIDLAIRQNRRQEWLIVVLLVVLFVVGVVLLIWGAYRRDLWLLAPGGLLQTTLVYPVLKLLQLRGQNIRLQIMPELMAMAETDEMKLLVVKFCHRLIEEV